MACCLLFRPFVGPRSRGGRTFSSVTLIEETADWLDAICRGSLLSRPKGAVRDVRDQRSSKTADGACRRGVEQLVTIGGVRLWQRGRRHEECADGRRSVRWCGADKRTRDEASKTQILIM